MINKDEMKKKKFAINKDGIKQIYYDTMSKPISLLFIVCILLSVILMVFLVLAAPSPINLVVLNSTFSTNTTSENLTVFVNPVTNSTQKYFYNWYKNNAPITIFNMPMDGGTLGPSTTFIDYALGNNGTGYGQMYNAVFYNITGGFNGKGVIYTLYDAGFYGGLISKFFNLTDNFSISIWVKGGAPPSSHSAGDHNIFCYTSAPYTPTDGWSFALFNNAGNDYISFIIFGSSSATSRVTDTSTFDISAYHNYIVTYIKNSSTGLNLYKDGNLIKTNSTTNLGNINYQTSSLIITGSDLPNATAGLYVDEPLIYNGTFTATQVKQLYNSYASPSYSSTFIHSSMLANGDTWRVNVFPNDNIADGTAVMSNNITITSSSTCPSSPQNWVVDLSTNPIISSMCNITGYNVTFANSGNLIVNSTFIFKNLNNFTSGKTIIVKSMGKIYLGK